MEGLGLFDRTDEDVAPPMQDDDFITDLMGVGSSVGPIASPTPLDVTPVPAAVMDGREWTALYPIRLNDRAYPRVECATHDRAYCSDEFLRDLFGPKARELPPVTRFVSFPDVITVDQVHNPRDHSTLVSLGVLRADAGLGAQHVLVTTCGMELFCRQLGNSDPTGSWTAAMAAGGVIQSLERLAQFDNEDEYVEDDDDAAGAGAVAGGAAVGAGTASGGALQLDDYDMGPAAASAHTDFGEPPAKRAKRSDGSDIEQELARTVETIREEIEHVHNLTHCVQNETQLYKLQCRAPAVKAPPMMSPSAPSGVKPERTPTPLSSAMEAAGMPAQAQHLFAQQQAAAAAASMFGLPPAAAAAVALQQQSLANAIAAGQHLAAAKQMAGAQLAKLAQSPTLGPLAAGMYGLGSMPGMSGMIPPALALAMQAQQMPQLLQLLQPQQFVNSLQRAQATAAAAAAAASGAGAAASQSSGVGTPQQPQQQQGAQGGAPASQQGIEQLLEQLRAQNIEAQTQLEALLSQYSVKILSGATPDVGMAAAKVGGAQGGQAAAWAKAMAAASTSQQFNFGTPPPLASLMAAPQAKQQQAVVAAATPSSTTAASPMMQGFGGKMKAPPSHAEGSPAKPKGRGHKNTSAAAAAAAANAQGEGAQSEEDLRFVLLIRRGKKGNGHAADPSPQAEAE
eukprot:m51a1_g3487 hypothetical protein (680) ;mRNA; f:788765-791325